MNTLLERFEKKEPQYPSVYENSIFKRFSEKAAFDQGGLRSDEEVFSGGRFFSRYYECFIYAAIVGMKANYSLPFDRAKDGKRFLLIEGWRPKRVTQFLLMSLLAVSEDNLESLEMLNEQEIDDKALQLVYLLERYAHGGLDLIDKKIKDNPYYFESAFSMAAFLKETGTTTA
jgi:hypothetical protein